MTSRYTDKDFLSQENEIVISGISGRFSEASNMEEFYDNLINHVDMISDNEKRFPRGYKDIHISGKMKEVDKFDNEFFNQTAKYVDVMSPEMRFGMEVAYEAIIDAGLSLDEVRETRTGVYIVGPTVDSMRAYNNDIDNINTNVVIGTINSVIANKISFALGLNGPSLAIDTACSSSLYALEEALRAVREGVVDQALVGGVMFFANPFMAYDFASMPLLSQTDHRCKSFDADCSGYVRGEGGAYILIQKRKDSKRSYARIIHTRCNVDGRSETGFLAPWGWRQYQLLRDVYMESGLKTSQVSYVECHGTGTKAGDPEEVVGLTTDGLMINGREEGKPLLIGSVKSNCGHGEWTSGLVALAKVVLTIKNKIIPANLHFDTPNPNIPNLINGKVKVVAENTEYDGGYIGINSFGVGGANAHVIIGDSDTRQSAPSPAGKEPRLFTYATRTEEGAQVLLDFAKNHSHSLEMQALLQPSANMSAHKMPFRLYTVLNGQSEVQEIEPISGTRPPIWFVFPGLGCQWAGMGQNMMKIPVFRETIERLNAFTMERFNIDLLTYFIEKPHEKSLDKTMVALPITAVQIGLINILKAVGVEADGMFGHSNGEVPCGYADGALTEEQTITVAYSRSCLAIKSGGKIGAGKMAAVGLTMEECKRRCPPGVSPACHNGHDSITISGNAAGVDALLAELKAEGIFAREVPSNGLAFHRPEWAELDDMQIGIMRPMIPKPKLRSSKWISTSFLGDDLNKDLAKYCAPEYYIENTKGPVYFHQAVQQIPKGAIVLEIGPYPLLSSVVKRTMENQLIPVAMMKKNHDDNIGFCFSNLGKLFLKGVDLNPLALHPPVQFPVPLDTPMLSSTISKTWNHTASWRVPKFSDFVGSGDSVDVHVDISENGEFRSMADNLVDGKPCIPESGYLYFAWRALAKKLKKDLESLAVAFQDVQFLERAFLSEEEKTTVKTRVSTATGRFEICNKENTLLATGTIRDVSGDVKPSRPATKGHKSDPAEIALKGATSLTKEDFYKALAFCGNEQKGDYQGVARASLDFSEYVIEWAGDWCRFLDALTQAGLSAASPPQAQGGASRARLVRLGALTLDPTRLPEESSTSVYLKAEASRLEKAISCCGVKLQRPEVNMENRDPETAEPPSSMDKCAFVPFTSQTSGSQTVDEALQYYADQCLSYAVGRLGQISPEAKKSPFDPAALKQVMSAPLPPSADAGKQENHKFERAYLAKSDCGMAQLLVKFLDYLCYNGESTLPEMTSPFQESLSRDKLLSSLQQSEALKPAVDLILDNLASSEAGPRKLEILEVGGNRVFSQLLPLLEGEPRVRGWTYSLAGKHGDEDLPGVRKVKWDISSSSASQGEAQGYNCVVLKNILHQQTDPKEALSRAMSQFSADGFLLVSEITDNFPLAYVVSQLIRTSEETNGTHQSNGPTSDRQLGLFFRDEAWRSMFSELGLQLVYQRTDGIMSSSYLLRKNPETAPTADAQVLVNLNGLNSEQGPDFTPYIAKVKAAISDSDGKPGAPRVWLVSTPGKEASADFGHGLVALTRTLQAEGIGQRVRCAVVSNLKEGSTSPDLSSVSTPDFAQLREKDLAVNVYRDGQWGFTSLVPVAGSEVLSITDDACLGLSVFGDASTLAWHHNLKVTGGAKNAAMTVYYAGLHQSDAATISGRLPLTDATQLSDVAILGRDAAGRLDDGRRVMAALPAACCTKVDTTGQFLLDIPENWTLEQAATVPAAYSTAYYVCHVKARLRRGDNVLVMDASDPAGQAVVRVALNLGCTVAATVRNEAAKTVVTKALPELSAERIVCRDSKTGLCQLLADAAGTRGFDAILSTLTASESRDSLATLAEGGTFFYVGEHGTQDLRELKSASDAPWSVQRVDIPLFLSEDGERAVSLRREVALMVSEGIQDGVVRPLDRSVYDKDDMEGIRDVLVNGHWTKQLVVKIQEVVKTPVPAPTSANILVSKRTKCNPDRSYLLVDGLAPFGIEVAHWLVKHGARKLLICSSQGVSSGYQQFKLNKMAELGAEVKVTTESSLTLTGAQQLLREAEKMGPLGGVFNLSLGDNQSSSLKCTLNLDHVTRSADNASSIWFVAFSSQCSGRGSEGLTNHSLGTTGIESICEKRRADGLQGLAIQWGPVDTGDRSSQTIQATDGQTDQYFTAQGVAVSLEALDLALSQGCPVLGIYRPRELSSESEGDDGTENSGPLTMLEKVIKVIGLNGYPGDAVTLGDAGIDSIGNTEVKQMVLEVTGKDLEARAIRALTFKEVKDMQK